MLMDWKINIVKVLTLCEKTYGINTLPIKIPKEFSLWNGDKHIDQKETNVCKVN